MLPTPSRRPEAKKKVNFELDMKFCIFGAQKLKIDFYTTVSHYSLAGGNCVDAVQLLRLPLKAISWT